jgi:translation initiation factor RLI1
VLDYLSDFICCLYGKPGAYGVVTLPFSVREGINIFLAGGQLLTLYNFYIYLFYLFYSFTKIF